MTKKSPQSFGMTVPQSKYPKLADLSQRGGRAFRSTPEKLIHENIPRSNHRSQLEAQRIHGFPGV